MKDEERARLAAALAHTTPKQLDEIHADATKALHNLEDINTSFPATQEFLQARGLKHVRDLDAQGKKDLRIHLEKILTSLCKGST